MKYSTLGIVFKHYCVQHCNNITQFHTIINKNMHLFLKITLGYIGSTSVLGAVRMGGLEYGHSKHLYDYYKNMKNQKDNNVTTYRKTVVVPTLTWAVNGAILGPFQYTIILYSHIQTLVKRVSYSKENPL